MPERGVRLPAPLAWRVRRGLDALHDAADRLVPDHVIYERQFRQTFGRPLDWHHPRSFNEKIHWLMRYYRRPVMTRLADKYGVRSFVRDRIGPQYLNDLYGVWARPEEISFSRLPSTFVLKATHGWKMNFFCRDKSSLDESACRRQLATWLRQSHYRRHREWAYKHIPRRIIAERLLEDPAEGTPFDYKFFCFSGEPLFIEVHIDRFRDHRQDFFDPKWNPLPFTRRHPPSGRNLPAPPTLDEMTDCARRLAAGFPFVRVDFYSIDSRVVLGEMTWYPDAGLAPFIPESYDFYWGQRLALPPLSALGHES